MWVEGNTTGGTELRIRLLKICTNLLLLASACLTWEKQESICCFQLSMLSECCATKNYYRQVAANTADFGQSYTSDSTDIDTFNQFTMGCLLCWSLVNKCQLFLYRFKNRREHFSCIMILTTWTWLLKKNRQPALIRLSVLSRYFNIQLPQFLLKLSAMKYGRN